jgi:hypothetical protein
LLRPMMNDTTLKQSVPDKAMVIMGIYNWT